MTSYPTKFAKDQQDLLNPIVILVLFALVIKLRTAHKHIMLFQHFFFLIKECFANFLYILIIIMHFMSLFWTFEPH